VNYLVYVEGLWNTGKSFFLERVKSKKPHDFFIFDNLRDLGSVRHCAYLLFPKIYSSRVLVFDRSPVTLKVLADQDLGLYTHEDICPGYWHRFYDEWLGVLRKSERFIVFIYFRPFFPYTDLPQSQIVDFVKSYPKNDLMIDSRRFNVDSMLRIHELFCHHINSLYRECRSRFEFIQVEYKDAKFAEEILLELEDGEE